MVMKYFIIIFVIISKNILTEEFTWNSTSIISKIHETTLPDGEKHLSFKDNRGIAFSS